MSGFKKAERKKAWIKIALTGPSGSGKTFSALQIASGMGKKIAFVDTENGSASLYSDKIEGGFDVLEIDPPYTIAKYVDAISQATKAGYEILIIDSISHAWSGEGGLLQQKEELDSRGGKDNRNKFSNWGQITKQQEQFKGWLLKADIHLIVTMRSKQDYVLGEGNKPIKVGLAPIQREGMEYEFTTVLDIAIDHKATASKDRTGLFDGGQIFQPTKQVGQALITWLNGGSGELTKKPVLHNNSQANEKTKQQPDPLTPNRKKLFAIANKCGYNEETLRALTKQNFPEITSFKQLSKLQIDTLTLMVQSKPIQKEEPKIEGPEVGSPEDIAAAANETIEDPFTDDYHGADGHP